MRRSIFILFVFIFFISFIMVSGEVDLKLFKGLKARSIGPAGMSGRIAAIDVVLSNTNIIFVGSAT